MPKVHEIKHARKDYPVEGIKKGDTYYKWSIKTGPATGVIHRSKTYPKPSDLTGSPFQKSLLEIQERISNLDASNYETAEDLSSDLEQITSDIKALRDETQGSLENMPEGLQQGDVGQMLQERIDGLEDWLNNLQGVDLNFVFYEEEPEEPEDKESEEHPKWVEEHDTWETAKQEAENEFISNAIEEIQGMEDSIYLVWKTRHKAGEDSDYFSFSIKREDFPALPLTADQFKMLFPRVNKDDVPEAPESGIIKIEGLLL